MKYLTPSNREQLELVSHSLLSAKVSSCQKTSTVPTQPNYEDRLIDPAHVNRMAQIARKQTRGSNVDWQDALQTAQIKLIVSIRAGKFASGTAQDFDRWASTVARFEIIDLVRKSKCRECDSVDRTLADNLTVLDTIADPFDPFIALETTDLIGRIRAAIIHLDKLYPDRSYYQLWLGKVNEQKQAEIAEQLGLTQSTISKRWQELLLRLTIELKLVPESIPNRTRSDRQW